jgi:hypothetical protein
MEMVARRGTPEQEHRNKKAKKELPEKDSQNQQPKHGSSYKTAKTWTARDRRAKNRAIRIGQPCKDS